MDFSTYLCIIKQRSNDAAPKKIKIMFTKVEDFNPNEVASAFITLAQDGTSAKDDNGKFYEFIRENQELFPGLDTSNPAAMNHANSLCEEVFSLNEYAILHS